MQSSGHVGSNGVPAQQHRTSRGNNKAEQWCQVNHPNKKAARTVRAAPSCDHESYCGSAAHWHDGQQAMTAVGQAWSERNADQGGP